MTDERLTTAKKVGKLRPDAFRRGDGRGTFLTSLPRWAAYAMIAWQVRLSIEALVGKDAVPSLLTRFGRETSYWELVCWVAGVLGVLFGLYNRHLLRRQSDTVQSRLEAIEKRLAAASSSSPMSFRPGP